MRPRVLVVDDEPSVVTTIAYNLRRDGFDVETARDGEQALARVEAHPPDALVLDVMLPGIDGLEVCRRIRRTSALPILMLTARDDEIDRVVGLEVGADDYLTKPFSMRELVARVKALIRRRDLLREEIAREPESELLESADLRLSPSTREVSVAGTPVRLKPKEFELLAFLMRHPGHVFSPERLLENVWGYANLTDTRTVPVHIRGLRRKIETDPSQPTRIETVRGVGYRFAG